MTLTSFSFFVFLFITVVIYYLFRPLQKYILVAASIFFYLRISPVNPINLAILMVCFFTVTYVGALVIDKSNGRVRKVFAILFVSALIFSLFLLKYAYNMLQAFSSLFKIGGDFSVFKFATIIGISYYALSAIGYLIDVYRQSYAASNNPVDIALFVFYFPQLISGPLTRFSNMKDKFNVRHKLVYDNIVYGIRRMTFGYFKKLVISERFCVVVTNIYGHYSDYSFVGIFIATLCYAVQLYTDFSGCMDIIMGASMLFGIELPENFNAPFFSETIQEFWQRWHITLGAWFKDYFMYPAQLSSPIQSIGTWMRKRFGKKAGKKATFYIAMVILWILIGVWHGGTGYYFIASALVPCMLLIISDFCQPLFKKINALLQVNTECCSWHAFRRVRTFLLLCICWFFVCSGGTHIAISIAKHMFTVPVKYTQFIASVSTLGMNSLDILIMAVGTVIIYISHRLEYSGTSIIKKMDEQNFVFRVILIYAEILLIFMHGMIGSSPFIYFQF